MNEADQEQMTVYVRGNDLPLVSVIIPVYNVTPYLREALNSVVQQTYSQMVYRPLRMLVWKVFRR